MHPWEAGISALAHSTDTEPAKATPVEAGEVQAGHPPAPVTPHLSPVGQGRTRRAPEHRRRSGGTEGDGPAAFTSVKLSLCHRAGENPVHPLPGAAKGDIISTAAMIILNADTGHRFVQSEGPVHTIPLGGVGGISPPRTQGSQALGRAPRWSPDSRSEEALGRGSSFSSQ